MRGLIFSEFLEMVESKYGYDMVDQIIQKSPLQSEGAYTTIGVYNHAELFQLIENLCVKTKTDSYELLKEFGQIVFERLVTLYPMYINKNDTVFSFLGKLENYIHVEVKKLHPESDLPTFDTSFIDENQLKMVYKSNKGLASLAEGMMIGCFAHFKEDIQILREDLSAGENTEVSFILKKNK